MKTEQIVKYAENFRNGLWGDRKGDGLCFAVSVAMCGALKTLGIDCRVVQYEVIGFQKYPCHYAIKIGDKILDPTFDQIEKDNPRIYFGNEPGTYIEI